MHIDTESIKREAGACAHVVGRMMDTAFDRPLARFRNHFNVSDIISSLLRRSDVRSVIQGWLSRLKA